jgi:DNA-binding GntR family transcriptional regulator
MRIRRAIRGIRTRKTGLDSGILAPSIRDHLRLFAGREPRDPLKAQAALSDHFGNARKRALDG